MMNRKHEDTCSGSERTSNAGLPVRRGRILVLASVLAVAPMVTGFPQVSSQVKAHPVISHVREVGFVKSSLASMRTGRNATKSVLSTPGAPDPITAARSGAVAPVQGVAGAVTVVGVTWPKGATSAREQFQIRTLTGATWSRWQPFDVDPADGPDPTEAAAATGGTSPYVVTGASKYEVRSLSTAPMATTAAKVQVVDPGTSVADSVHLTQILGVGDYNGDGRADLMARSGVGRLWLFPGNGLGTVGGRQPVSGGEGAGHVLG